MNKKQKAAEIKKTLNNLFPAPTIPLQHSSPYTLLIAVLLSAQCTDERVNQVSPFLFASANTPEKMIQLSIADIEEMIRPCGIYRQKAKAIWELSKMLIEQFQGQVPRDLLSLESLPGVGHKTASVIQIQAFSIPAFPVDTHIHRCAKRWGLSSGKNVLQTEQDLKKLFCKRDWGKLHLQIIYYARKYCRARGHKDENCLICKQIKGSRLDPSSGP